MEKHENAAKNLSIPGPSWFYNIPLERRFGLRMLANPAEAVGSRAAPLVSQALKLTTAKPFTSQPSSPHTGKYHNKTVVVASYPVSELRSRSYWTLDIGPSSYDGADRRRPAPLRKVQNEPRHPLPKSRVHMPVSPPDIQRRASGNSRALQPMFPILRSHEGR